MYQLKMTYFDFHGGRAEPARIAMHIGGIVFEDNRFTFDKFPEIRKTTPLGQVPTLHIDGKQVTQCNAINRFVGKLAGLYPEDPMQALLCDEIMEALEDVSNKLSPTLGLEGEALKLAREALVQGPFTQYFEWLEEKLEGEYFVGGRLSMADLKVFAWVNGVCSGRLDYIPTTLVQNVAPKVAAHHKRIAELPAVVAYYSHF